MQFKRRQRLFAEYYLATWSVTEAARLAGYQNKNLNAAGQRLIGHPLIKAYIEDRLRALGMEANEVIGRLSQQARTNIADFLIEVERTRDDGTTYTEIALNMAIVRERGYLIKKLSYDKQGRPVLELHDAQNALVQLGRHLALFVDRQENTNVNVEVSADDLAAARAKAAAIEQEILSGGAHDPG